MVVSLEVSHCATNTSIESFTLITMYMQSNFHVDILSHRPQFFFCRMQYHVTHADRHVLVAIIQEERAASLHFTLWSLLQDFVSELRCSVLVDFKVRASSA